MRALCRLLLSLLWLCCSNPYTTGKSMEIEEIRLIIMIIKKFVGK
jgi:hypothetical protein